MGSEGLAEATGGATYTPTPETPLSDYKLSVARALKLFEDMTLEQISDMEGCENAIRAACPRLTGQAWWKLRQKVWKIKDPNHASLMRQKAANKRAQEAKKAQRERMKLVRAARKDSPVVGSPGMRQGSSQGFQRILAVAKTMGLNGKAVKILALASEAVEVLDELNEACSEASK